MSGPIFFLYLNAPIPTATIKIHKIKTKYRVKNQEPSSPFSLCHKEQFIFAVVRAFLVKAKSWTN